MGVAVSKKHGKAVKRNRIKRLIRSAFSDNVSALSKTYSIIVIPKVAESYTYKQFDKSFKICFRKVNECAET